MSTHPWRLQKSNRPNGAYFQAVSGKGANRATATLGYLSEAEVALAEENLAYWHDRWERTGKGDLFKLEGSEVKRALLTPPADVEGWLADKLLDDIADAKLEAGAYGDLKLRDFVWKVWMPVRKKEAAPKTYYGEEVWTWPRILGVLGDVPLKRLDTVRWTRFLMAQEDLSGRSRAILQTGYRACMRYAEEVGAIPEVHAFRPVKGANQTTLEPGVALTPEEVGVLLDATSTPMHRALFAFAFGQGCRPAEATRLRWEDIDWEAGTVFIRGTKTSKSARRIAITPATSEELIPYWESLSRPKSGPAFTWKGKPVKSWRTAWETALKRSGLAVDEEGNPRRVIPYTARYTFTTVAILSGAKDAAIRASLGHSAGSRLMETCYTRLKLKEVAAEMVKFPTFKAAAK